MSSKFDIAVSITLDPEHEGGFQKNPKDRGNWTGDHIGEGELKGTNHGISAAEFPDLNIENLTIDEIKNLYFTAPQHYWNPIYDKIDEQTIVNKLFDLGVLFGPHVAVKVLQFTLFSQFPTVSIDGDFGPITLAAVNQSEPISLLAAYKTAFVAHAIKVGADHPTERPFVGDWIRRINS